MAIVRVNSYDSSGEQEARWGPHDRFKGKLLSSTPIIASFQHTAIADMGLCRFKATGAFRVEPTGSRHGERYIKVLLQLKETSYLEAEGGTVALLPRQWMIVDEANPCTATGPNGTEALILMIPREKLAAEGDTLDAVAMCPFSGEVGLGKLVWQFIHSVYDEVSKLEAQSEPGIVDAIAHLVRLAIIGSLEIRLSGLRNRS